MTGGRAIPFKELRKLYASRRQQPGAGPPRSPRSASRESPPVSNGGGVPESPRAKSKLPLVNGSNKVRRHCRAIAGTSSLCTLVDARAFAGRTWMHSSSMRTVTKSAPLLPMTSTNGLAVSKEPPTSFERRRVSLNEMECGSCAL